MRYRRRQRSSSNLALILFGVVFALGGVFAGVVFGQTSTLRCERLESTVVDCRLQRDLLGFSTGETAVGQVDSARVDVRSDSDGDTYRVMLQGPEGSTPLTSYYTSSRAGKDQTVDTINQFVLDPQETALEIEESTWWAFLLTAIFVIVGGFCVAWGVLRAIFGFLRG